MSLKKLFSFNRIRFFFLQISFLISRKVPHFKNFTKITQFISSDPESEKCLFGEFLSSEFSFDEDFRVERKNFSSELWLLTEQNKHRAFFKISKFSKKESKFFHLLFWENFLRTKRNNFSKMEIRKFFKKRNLTSKTLYSFRKLEGNDFFWKT